MMESNAESLKTNIEILDKFDNVNKFYEGYAPAYDSEFSEQNYAGPRLAAEAVRDHFMSCNNNNNNNNIANKNVAQIEVMDIAAGTGLVGKWLFEHGFRSIDAVDACPEMLNVLRQKNVYRNAICSMIVSGEELEVKENSYDAVVVSGGFVKGHMPLYALDEMIRMCKKGGVVVICMRLEYLSTVDEYNELEERMRCLEREGRWKMISRQVIKKYILDKDGLTYKFIKL